MITNRKKIAILFPLVVLCLSVASDVEASPQPIGLGISSAGLTSTTSVGSGYIAIGQYKNRTNKCNTTGSTTSPYLPVDYETSFGCANPATDATYTIMFLHEPIDELTVCSTFTNCWNNAYAYAEVVRSGGVWTASTTGSIYETSTTSAECSTCTRIVSIDPGNAQNTSTSTNKLFQLDYYLNEEDDPLLGDIYISIEITRGSDAEKETHLIDIDDTQYNDQTLYFNSLLVTETGTYTVTYDMYIDRPFNFFNSSLDFGYTYFYVSTTTDWDNTPYGGNFTTDKGIIETVYGSISCDVTILDGFNYDDFECMAKYLIATVIPPADVLATESKGLLETVLLLPPWGYLTQLYITLANPATTTVPTLELTGETDTPLAGFTISLDPTDGLTMLQSNFSATTTILGTSRSYYDHFIYYWNWLWYIVFGLWLLNKFLGYNITISHEQNALNDRSTFKNRGTLDMSKPRSGTVEVKKG